MKNFVIYSVMISIVTIILLSVSNTGTGATSSTGGSSSTSGMSDARPRVKEEQICMHNGGSSTEPAVCNVEVTKDPELCHGQGGYIVTTAKCSKQVTTYADDACNGPKGHCYPPSTNPSSIKSTSQPATPSLKAGDCTPNPPTCSCTPKSTFNYQFGRKTCS